MMISVEEAKSRLHVFQPKLNSVELEVKDSGGFILASDVKSPVDMPPFPQSAMDGYALGSGDRIEGSEFKLVGEIAAGSAERFQLKANECVRIFTGSAVPKSAVAVIQQEWVERDGEMISLTREVSENQNIRPQAEQMKTGSVALEKGMLITPATIGFLNMLGIRMVEVYRKPTVAILVTGNELVPAGENLEYGQVYESNAQMLQTALKNEGVESEFQHVQDSLEATKTAIENAFDFHDLVIISGGISVGDHDYVGTALNELGAEEVFYKVLQKPGKPLYFGLKEGKAVFALPGNPAASLTCFYEYVLPLVRRSLGREDETLLSLQLPFASGRVSNIGRAQFLKARVEKGAVHILEGQSSAMLNTFAQSNALAYVKSNSSQPQVGDLIEVHLLPV
ncbi:MAG: molybdopterin molybdotransferase MoeA [Flavobacteriales bacterium]|nr:molybdopterin molybdotransferase MoeA [Flavobacteriales bacterium]